MTRSLTGGGTTSPQSQRVWSADGLAPTLEANPSRWGGANVPLILESSAAPGAASLGVAQDMAAANLGGGLGLELTHASFFTGAGGLDLGLARAGWRTVSTSEIEPYACALIAERYPDAPNLGDIFDVAAAARAVGDVGGGTAAQAPAHRDDRPGDADAERLQRAPDWQRATLWSGGFPCQDLSVAGKRRGLAGERSGLAFAFLDLVERYRPAALVLENVPGLLSSHGGRDLGALVGTLGDIGYWWAFRVLDARYFGVPQRRQRVFIIAIHASVDPAGGRAAEVLSVGCACPRHPAAGGGASTDAATGPIRGSADTVGALPAGVHGFPDSFQEYAQGFFRVVRPAWRRVRCDCCDDWACAQHGGHIGERCDCWPCDWCGNLFPAAALDDSGQCATCAALDPDGVRTADGLAGWVDGSQGVAHGAAAEAALSLVPGLDTHRYRLAGNGVVAPVATWLGLRLAAALG